MNVVEWVFWIVIFAPIALGAARRSGWSYARNDDLNYLEYGIATMALIMVIIGAYMLGQIGLS